ncbi:hypothetical protein MG293_005329 [Ovis ammon polii]|uniref:Uncharacterized protein n=1 Tax=Ovis ammon polii TaxID=230172 RepID=A0AAD4UF72_OVIAM|nr:hypothetical protein MG293_005329 [Ovis ammon polii]
MFQRKMRATQKHKQIQILMEKIKAILQQNPDRNMKENSTILVFYYHRQSKKKTENRPTADEETPEDSSNTSPDNSPITPWDEWVWVIVSVNTVAKPQGLIDPVSLFPPELIRTCLSGSLWRETGPYSVKVIAGVQP